MHTNTPTVLVIVGISGDLAKRKLLPAIAQLAAAQVLPEEVKIIGITRRSDITVDSLIDALPDATYLREHLELLQMDLTSASDYATLAARLNVIDRTFASPGQHLYYLSVPPAVSHPIIELLGRAGLNVSGIDKLLLEKPFGVDLVSATELVEHINTYYKPEAVYRIDHYLAKETAQNLIVFREGNSLFKRTWNSDFIESIDIIASEQIDIEGRGNFYESTGALRDLVQSHLLQLAALTLMETPAAEQLQEIPARRLEALKHLSLPIDISALEAARRGQYDGYAEAAGNPGSTVETFVHLQLKSSDPRWAGVPITITTGKALADKATEIHLTYKRDRDYESNKLTLRLQPNEGIEVCLWTKKPGYAIEYEQHGLKFNYADHFDHLPEAYERVLLDAINSDHSLFATSEEVLETWRILAPVQAAWDMAGRDGLIHYKPGTTDSALL